MFKNFRDITCGLNAAIVIIIIIIVVVVVVVVSVLQCIYNYIPETNHVSMLYSVAAVLYLQSVLHVMLFRVLNIFCTFTLALPSVFLQCTVWLFFFLQFLNFALSWYFAQVLSKLFWVGSSRPLLSLISHFAFTFHMRWISIVKSFYFRIFSVSF